MRMGTFAIECLESFSRCDPLIRRFLRQALIDIKTISIRQARFQESYADFLFKCDLLLSLCKAALPSSFLKFF